MKRLAYKLICASVLFSFTPAWGDDKTSRVDAKTGESMAVSSIADVNSSLFFTLDGKTRFYTGRAPFAQNLEGYESQFDIAQAAGEKLIRVSLMTGNSPARFRHGWARFFQTGKPNTEFLESWDRYSRCGVKMRVACLRHVGRSFVLEAERKQDAEPR